MIFADSVSGGYVVGNLVAAALVFVLGLCASYFFARFVSDFRQGHTRYGGRYTYKGDVVAGGVLVLLALVTIGFWAWATYPFSYDYHHWVVKEGEVSQVSSRIISDGSSGISQRFVVVLDGQALGVDDTRASLLRVGDHVRLKCKKEFEWGTAETSQGWGCKWADGVS